jgi:hypothetical protein
MASGDGMRCIMRLGGSEGRFSIDGRDSGMETIGCDENRGGEGRQREELVMVVVVVV